MNYRPILLVLSLASGLFTGAAYSQHRPESMPPPPPRLPGPCVIFYSEPFFHGERLVVEGDVGMPDLAKVRDERGRKWDDRIASVQIEGPFLVTIYDDPRYRGERLELQHSVPDFSRLRHGETGLENWDHRVTAIKVAVFQPRQPIARSRGYYHSQIEADRAIQAAFREFFGRDADFPGLQMYRRRLLDDGWDEAALHREIRNSREYKSRDFDRIVRRCYKEVMGREPDPSGLSTYTRAMRDKGWTENELRNELRHSDEARRNLAREIVNRAYRDILGREPDPQGRATYEQRVVDGWTENRVRDDLRDSQEFRNRRR